MSLSRKLCADAKIQKHIKFWKREPSSQKSHKSRTRELLFLSTCPTQRKEKKKKIFLIGESKKSQRTRMHKGDYGRRHAWGSDHTTMFKKLTQISTYTLKSKLQAWSLFKSKTNHWIEHKSVSPEQHVLLKTESISYPKLQKTCQNFRPASN